MRFVTGQVFSSLGDWVGLIAILAIVKRLYDNEFAVAAVLLARLGPALFIGPLAGVLADRFNRKTLMVSCDIARAALVASLAFVAEIGHTVPLLNPVVVLFVVSALLETLTLLWQPAKDASVPDMVERSQFTHAYSLLLLSVYVTFPIAGIVFGLLARASSWLGPPYDRENIALLFDTTTFLISALLTITIKLPRRKPVIKKLSLRSVWSELSEGLAFIKAHPMVRPWVVGVAGTFAGIGVFMSVAIFFVSDVLGGGSASYGFLITAVGVGLGSGFILAGPVSRFVPKDILFSSVVMGLGVGIVWFGSVSTPSAAFVLAGVCGFFGGFAYPSGYALVQEKLGPELRGRASAAVNTVIRLAIVGAAAVTPALVKGLDEAFGEPMIIFSQVIDLRGIRMVTWAAGFLIFVAGLVTTKSVRIRWHSRLMTPGVFIVFEGGEGTGKTTQISLLRDFLESQGKSVLVTREPGGTEIGERIRSLLLDPRSTPISPKSEALLYAADRAQHVVQVITPALEAGTIVISDRYLDSSVAYQGLARGLGAEEIRGINRWGTGGLMPDIVFLLDFDVEEGLIRSGVTDRIEQEGLVFHEKVREAYRTLANRYADRFVVIDGSSSQDAIAAEIRASVGPLLERVVESGKVSVE